MKQTALCQVVQIQCPNVSIKQAIYVILNKKQRSVFVPLNHLSLVMHLPSWIGSSEAEIDMV